MKTFDFDWTRFIENLPTWELLPTPCREFFLFHTETNRRMALGNIGIDVAPLIDAGFLEYAANPTYVKLRRACLPFRQIMRAMSRHSFFGTRKAGIEDLQAYLDEHLSIPDQIPLSDGLREPSRPISQLSWLDAFRGCASFRLWEDTHKSDRRKTRMLFESDDCFQKTKQIVEVLMLGSNPLPFSAIVDALGVRDPADYAVSIRAGVAYALLFPALGNGDLVPVIGIWPGIHRRLHRRRASAPSPVRSVRGKPVAPAS